MGRPLGAYTRGSLSQRIRELLADGAERSAEEIASALGEPLPRVRQAIHRVRGRGELTSVLRYSIPPGASA